MNITSYDGEDYEVNGCLGCFLKKNNINILYKDETFNVAQDFELPINGFIIISANKHISSINDLTEIEQLKLIKLISKVLKLLKSYGICENYNIVQEEKSDYHFHVWLMPSHKWMKDKFGNTLKNIKSIQEYSKNNLKTKDNLRDISITCKKLKRDLNN